MATESPIGVLNEAAQYALVSQPLSGAREGSLLLGPAPLTTDNRAQL